MPLPLDWKPDRGSADSYARIREQARIQVEARAAGVSKFELLPVEAGFGLTRLPEPSDGDIFLDLEGDPFVGEHGLEYLFGYVFNDAHGASRLRGRLGLHARRREARLRDIRRFRHGALGAISRPAHLPLRAIRAGGAEASDGPLRDARGRDRPHASRRALRRSVSGRAPRPPRERRKLLDQAAGAVLRHSSARRRSPMRMSRSPISRPISNWAMLRRSPTRPRPPCAPTTRMTAAPPRPCATGSKRCAPS